MTVALSDRARTLLESRNFAHMATLMPDGSPQVTPVWVDYNGTHILVNTLEGSIKARNLNEDPRVAVTISNIDNPFEYMAVRGHAVELTHEGAEDHVDRLAKKYLGEETYSHRKPGDRRLLVKIAPEHVLLRSYAGRKLG